jgi:hypothetical protein
LAVGVLGTSSGRSRPAARAAAAVGDPPGLLPAAASISPAWADTSNLKPRCSIRDAGTAIIWISYAEVCRPSSGRTFVGQPPADYQCRARRTRSSSREAFSSPIAGLLLLVKLDAEIGRRRVGQADDLAEGQADRLKRAVHLRRLDTMVGEEGELECGIVCDQTHLLQAKKHRLGTRVAQAKEVDDGNALATAIELNQPDAGAVRIETRLLGVNELPLDCLQRGSLRGDLGGLRLNPAQASKRTLGPGAFEAQGGEPLCLLGGRGGLDVDANQAPLGDVDDDLLDQPVGLGNGYTVRNYRKCQRGRYRDASLGLGAHCSVSLPSASGVSGAFRRPRAPRGSAPRELVSSPSGPSGPSWTLPLTSSSCSGF